MTIELINGNSLEVLKTMEDGIIQTCVTSPPYYGLRDYGTATWVGGDPKCSHKRDSKWSAKTITGHRNALLAVGDGIYKDVCKVCGAIRNDEQIGLETSPEDYINNLVGLFSEVRRVLKDDGTLWLNIGDSYNGSKPYGSTKTKDLIGIPWMLAFALRADGWYLRQDIIWAKPNPMPESVKDRCTKSHEYIFLLSKSPRYYFDSVAIEEPAKYDGRKQTKMAGSKKYKDVEYLANGNANSLSVGGRERWRFKNLQEDGQQPNSFHESRARGEKDKVYAVRNKRDVWFVATKPYKEAHFATFPQELITPCILAGSKAGDTVLDPFNGAGTTGLVSKLLGRNYIGIDLNKKYIELSKARLDKDGG